MAYAKRHLQKAVEHLASAQAGAAHGNDAASRHIQPEGFTKVDLHVDSSNSYGAPGLCRRAGLDIRYA